MEFSCFLKDFPNIGLIKYGNAFFAHIAPLTNEGTIISNREELAACKIVLATLCELIEAGENFGIFSKDG